ncbi:MAG: Flp pilus assembly protein CpaB [Polyangiales bacterium]
MTTADETPKLKGARRALAVSGIAALASALLAGFYLHSYEQAVSGGEPVAILRAARPLERGMLLSDDMLVESRVPSSYLEARAVRASERAKVRGLRMGASLETQDALQWSDLAVSQERRDLSALVQPGSRAVTVEASRREGSGGTDMVRPGDYIDLLAVLRPQADSHEEKNAKLVSVMLLQRVLVLAVGSETDPRVLRAEELAKKLADRDTNQLTLSLKVAEAQLLALARERGSFSFILRRPDDTRIVEGAPELPISSLFDSGFRNELQQQRALSQRPVRLAVVPEPR